MFGSTIVFFFFMASSMARGKGGGWIDHAIGARVANNSCLFVHGFLLSFLLFSSFYPFVPNYL